MLAGNVDATANVLAQASVQAATEGSATAFATATATAFSVAENRGSLQSFVDSFAIASTQAASNNVDAAATSLAQTAVQSIARGVVAAFASSQATAFGQARQRNNVQSYAFAVADAITRGGELVWGGWEGIGGLRGRSMQDLAWPAVTSLSARVVIWNMCSRPCVPWLSQPYLNCSCDLDHILATHPHLLCPPPTLPLAVVHFSHPPAGNDATEAYATAFAQAAAAGGDQAQGLVQAVAAVSCEGGARAQAFAQVGRLRAVCTGSRCMCCIVCCLPSGLVTPQRLAATQCLQSCATSCSGWCVTQLFTCGHVRHRLTHVFLSTSIPHAGPVCVHLPRPPRLLDPDSSQGHCPGQLRPQRRLCSGQH
jgi:hypothetical protein